MYLIDEANINLSGKISRTNRTDHNIRQELMGYCEGDDFIEVKMLGF